jgi:hypothetical protein
MPLGNATGEPARAGSGAPRASARVCPTPDLCPASGHLSALPLSRRVSIVASPGTPGPAARSKRARSARARDRDRWIQAAKALHRRSVRARRRRALTRQLSDGFNPRRAVRAHAMQSAWLATTNQTINARAVCAAMESLRSRGPSYGESTVESTIECTAHCHRDRGSGQTTRSNRVIERERHQRQRGTRAHAPARSAAARAHFCFKTSHFCIFPPRGRCFWFQAGLPFV